MHGEKDGDVAGFTKDGKEVMWLILKVEMWWKDGGVLWWLFNHGNKLVKLKLIS